MNDKVKELLNEYNINKNQKIKKQRGSFNSNNNSFLQKIENIKKLKNNKNDQNELILEKLKKIKNKLLKSEKNEEENKINNLNKKMELFDNNYDFVNYNNIKKNKSVQYYNLYFGKLVNQINDQNKVIFNLNKKINKINKNKKIKNNQPRKIINNKNDKIIKEPLLLKMILKSKKIPNIFKNYIKKNKHLNYNELIQLLNFLLVSNDNDNTFTNENNLKNDSPKKEKIISNPIKNIHLNNIPISLNFSLNINNNKLNILPKFPLIKKIDLNEINLKNESFKNLSKKIIKVENPRISMKSVNSNRFLNNVNSNRFLNNANSNRFLNNVNSKKYINNLNSKKKLDFNGISLSYENLEEDINEGKLSISNIEKPINNNEKKNSLWKNENDESLLKNFKKKEKIKKYYRIIFYRLYFTLNIQKILWEISDERYDKSKKFFETDLHPTIDNFVNDFNVYFLKFIDSIKNFKFLMNKSNKENDLKTSIENLINIISEYFNDKDKNNSYYYFINILSYAFLNGSYLPDDYLNKFEIKYLIFSYSGYISYKNKEKVNRMLIEGLIIIRLIIFMYLFNIEKVIKNKQINAKIIMNLKVIGIVLYHLYIKRYKNINVSNNISYIHEKRKVKIKNKINYFDTNNATKINTNQDLPIFGIPQLETLTSKENSNIINTISLNFNQFSNKILKIVKEFKDNEIKNIKKEKENLKNN